MVDFILPHFQDKIGSTNVRIQDVVKLAPETNECSFSLNTSRFPTTAANWIDAFHAPRSVARSDTESHLGIYQLTSTAVRQQFEAGNIPRFLRFRLYRPDHINLDIRHRSVLHTTNASSITPFATIAPFAISLPAEHPPRQSFLFFLADPSHHSHHPVRLVRLVRLV